MKDVFPLGQFGVIHRLEGIIVQLGNIDCDQLEQVAHRQHIAPGVEHIFVLVQPQLGSQHSPTGLVHIALDLQPNNRCEAPLTQLRLDHRQQVISMFFIALGVRIARDPEHIDTDDVHLGH